MRRHAFVSLLVAAGLPLGAQSVFVRSERGPATIEVNAAKTAAYRIPRSIYGTFLEPIGRSIYGGLWAQVLENPSFEENLWSAEQIRRMIENEPALGAASRQGLPLPWEPLEAAQGARYEPRWGDAANSSRSLLLMALPDRQTGVRQQVYLPVHRVLRYTGSIWARHQSGPPEIEVSLRRRNRPEDTLARAPLKLAGRDWARYEFAFELERGRLARLEPADFVIACSKETRVLIDQAWLFPADHVEGMDPDMLAMARALKTPLVRFGGNYAPSPLPSRAHPVVLPAFVVAETECGPADPPGSQGARRRQKGAGQPAGDEAAPAASLAPAPTGAGQEPRRLPHPRNGIPPNYVNLLTYGTVNS